MYLKHNDPQRALEYFEIRLSMLQKVHSCLNRQHHSETQKLEIEKSLKFIELIRKKIETGGHKTGHSSNSGKENLVKEELNELEVRLILLTISFSLKF
jgi:hypothetical protein